MREIDFDKLFSKGFAFLEEPDKKVILLILDNKQDAEKTLEYLKSNPFKLDVSLTKTETVNLKLKITKTGKYAMILTNQTKNEWSQLSWLINHQLTHVTTGYFDDQNNLQYISPFYQLENSINLN